MFKVNVLLYIHKHVSGFLAYSVHVIVNGGV
jgi:hypothetical protein